MTARVSAQRLVQALLEDVYSSSSTQINLPDGLSDLLLKWGVAMIPEKHLYYDEKGELGREKELHITTKYGLTGDRPSKELREILSTTVPFTVRLGKVSLFKNDEYDVVKVGVESPPLRNLNAAITAQCACAPSKFKDYTPHVMLAYVKSGTCSDLAGLNPFRDAPEVPPDFEAQELIFSAAGDGDDPNRFRVILPFNHYRQESESARAFLLRTVRPKTLFAAVKQAGIPYDHHETDLYVPVTLETTVLLSKYPKQKAITTSFHSRLGGKLWYDVPFAYEPAWDKNYRADEC